MDEHDCSDWDVVWDARGHLFEPHTDHEVAIGTLEVRRYIEDAADEYQLEDPYVLGIDKDRNRWPTKGPHDRYQAIMFIEKEGFFPLFKRVKLAERYDIAIMSNKGMSVTAGRALIDQMCGNHDIPLLVVRDFDKSGFSILRTVSKSNKRYAFDNDI